MMRLGRSRTGEARRLYSCHIRRFSLVLNERTAPWEHLLEAVPESVARRKARGRKKKKEKKEELVSNFVLLHQAFFFFFLYLHLLFGNFVCTNWYDKHEMEWWFFCNLKKQNYPEEIIIITLSYKPEHVVHRK